MYNAKYVYYILCTVLVTNIQYLVNLIHRHHITFYYTPISDLLSILSQVKAVGNLSYLYDIYDPIPSLSILDIIVFSPCGCMLYVSHITVCLYAVCSFSDMVFAITSDMQASNRSVLSQGILLYK
jgi:hypothetical protein